MNEFFLLEHHHHREMIELHLADENAIDNANEKLSCCDMYY